MTNAFIACSKHNINLKKCVDRIESITDNLNGKINVSICSGPWFFRKNISIDDNVSVLPTKTMYPIHYRNKNAAKNFKTTDNEIYGIHHWDKNW